jgi:hypothetical protein
VKNLQILIWYRWLVCLTVPVAVLLCCGGCKEEVHDGADPEVTSRGSIEVTARLVEILGLEQWDGQFPSNDLGYDYVYILKYEVEKTHRGEIDGRTILVGHYNPLKPRAEVADARCPDIGGDLKRFRVGDVHRMALKVPIDDNYMGPIINKYFDKPEGKGPHYWAVWTNRVSG